MKTAQERILLVESDPEIIDVIGRQTLHSLGYHVEVARTAGNAIQLAASFAPEAILADIDLPGLSGKDLLVAFSSQGLDTPVIVLAKKGMEGDLIQAFRLGATDYLLWPAREAEVVTVVERVMKQVRSRREKEDLARQLEKTNAELQRRVRELTTIFAVGKAVTSVTNQKSLFEKIVEGAVYVSEADRGWLLLRDERSKAYRLSAQRNLPEALLGRLNQPWEDGISSLVALSGEPLSIHGEPLERFKVSHLGQSVLVVPVKANKEVVGLLTVVRKTAKPFQQSSQTLLEAVADYASISLVNARLFKALEERALALQQAADRAQANELRKDEILQQLCTQVSTPLLGAKQAIDTLLVGEQERLNASQRGVLRSIHEKLQHVSDILNAFEHQQPIK